MSMKSWSQNGYGFDGKTLDKFSLEAKISFTQKYLPDLYEDVAKDCESREDWEDYFDNQCMDQFNSDSSGFGNIFVEVLREKEGWNVDYCTGEMNYSTIMINECLPWQMSESMKNLTLEKFEETVNKYVDELKELDKQDIAIDFDYETVEYYG